MGSACSADSVKISQLIHTIIDVVWVLCCALTLREKYLLFLEFFVDWFYFVKNNVVMWACL